MTRDDPARVLHLPTGEIVTILASGPDDGAGVLEVEALLPPGLGGPPPHRHRDQTETFTVHEGRLRVRAGGRTRVLVPGESVVVPPTTVHAFANPFDEPARIRVTEDPAGPLEEQFRALARGGRVPPLGELAAVNVRHGLPFALHGLPDGLQRPAWRLLAWLHHHARLP